MNGKPERRPTVDPAVAQLLDDQNRRDTNARLPKAERDRRKRELEKIRNRSRYVTDLPPEDITRVKTMAADERTTGSQVVGLALAMFFERVDKGEIDLEDYKIAIDSPRYQYILSLRDTP